MVKHSGFWVIWVEPFLTYVALPRHSACGGPVMHGQHGAVSQCNSLKGMRGVRVPNPLTVGECCRWLLREDR